MGEIMIILAYENGKSNVKNAEFVADAYSDLANISDNDLVFGTTCYVIEENGKYIVNSSKQWVKQGD
jgi:hypothetical protein